MSALEKLKKLRDKINKRRISQGLTPRIVANDDKVFEEYKRLQDENKSNKMILIQ
jgi:hypothetical protein